MPAWREPPRHSIYDANTLNQKQRRASTKSTLLSCAAESANLPAQQRSETALAWGCWPLAAEQAASQRSPVPALRPQPRSGTSPVQPEQPGPTPLLSLLLLLLLPLPASPQRKTCQSAGLPCQRHNQSTAQQLSMVKVGCRQRKGAGWLRGEAHPSSAWFAVKVGPSCPTRRRPRPLGANHKYVSPGG